MPVGLCPRCTKRHDCGFRQPGTWADECPAYEPDQQALASQLGGADEPEEPLERGGPGQTSFPRHSRGVPSRRKP